MTSSNGAMEKMKIVNLKDFTVPAETPCMGLEEMQLAIEDGPVPTVPQPSPAIPCAVSQVASSVASAASAADDDTPNKNMQPPVSSPAVSAESKAADDGSSLPPPPAKKARTRRVVSIPGVAMAIVDHGPPEEPDEAAKVAAASVKASAGTRKEKSQ